MNKVVAKVHKYSPYIEKLGMGRSDKTLPFPNPLSEQERSPTKPSKHPKKGLLHEKLLSFILSS